MSFFVRAGALLLAMLMLLGTFVGCGGVFDPLGYLKDSLERTFERSLAGQIVGVLWDALEQGSVSLDFGGTGLVPNLPDAAKLKMWFDAQDGRVAADASLVLAGQTFEAQAFLSEREAVVVSPTFFGSNTLGVGFATLENDLRTSIFSNNSGTIFSNPLISAAGADRAGAIKDGALWLLASPEDALDTADEVVDFFLEALTTYATHTRYRQDGRIYITLEIDNDALSRAVRATHEMLADDRSVRDFFSKIATTLDSITSAITGVTATEYATQIKHFLNGEEDIDRICLAIDQAPAFCFALEAGIRFFGMDLEQLAFSFTQNEEKRLDVALLLAEDDEQSELSVTWDGTAHKLTYQVTEDGFRTYAAQFSYQRTCAQGEAAMLTGELKANKREDTFELSFDNGTQASTFTGEYLFEDDEMMLSVKEASVGGARKKLSLSLQLNADEKMPDVPEYVNVVKMDVVRFTPIHTRATLACAQFVDAWIGLNLTPPKLLWPNDFA